MKCRLNYALLFVALFGSIYAQLVADADTDSCLSVSVMSSVTDALKSNTTLINLLRDASTLEQIAEGVQQLYKSVVDLPAVKSGYVTTPYVGLSNDNNYALRDCSLPENEMLTGCAVEGSHWIALVRNTAVFSDQVRHRFGINSDGQMLVAPTWVDANPFLTTQRPWYTTQGWLFFQQSFGTGLSTYTLSVSAATGAVVAVDRSWREPCNECLEDSPAEPAVLRVLDTFPEYPEDIPASLTTLLGVLIESDSPSVLQVQVGFNTGDLFLVKDCLHFELRDAAPACSNNDRYLGLVVHSSLATPRAYRLSLNGVESSGVTSVTSNATQQSWFTVGSEQTKGFTHPLLTASAAVVARSYSMQFAGGVVSVEISERECFAQPSDTQELVADPDNDECLSKSTVDEALKNNVLDLPDLSGIDSLEKLGTAVKSFAAVFNSTFVNNFVTAMHYGSANEYFSLRPCYQPENIVQAGCDGFAYFSLYTSSVAVFGDKRLRIFPVTSNGDVGTPTFASTTPFNLTTALWYTQATQGTWTQRGGLYPSYTYSTPVTGGVWAIDRSYREPCDQCLTDSVSSDVANDLMLWANGRQVVNVSRDSFKDIIQTIWLSLNSQPDDIAIQAYYGLWDGSFFMVKRCSAVEFNSESPCSSASPFTAWILRRDVFGDFKRHVFNLDSSGALTANEIFTSGEYFPTSRVWYQIGRTAGYGWSGVFAHASSSMSGRTFARQFNAGVIGVDFTTRECEPRAPKASPVAISSSGRVRATLLSAVAVVLLSCTNLVVK